MLRQRIFRVTVLVAILLALAIVTLSFKEIHLPGFDREGNGPLGLTLGLDLQGGSFLIYQAAVPDEIDVTYGALAEGDPAIEEADVLAAIQSSGHPEARIKASEDTSYTIRLQGLQPEEEDQIRDALADVSPIIDFRVRQREVTTDDMKGVVDTIQRRISALGTTEPQVQRLGSDRVMVQLPGVEDVEAAKELIGQTAQLVFLERTCTNADCSQFTEVQIGPEPGLTGDDLSDAFSDRDAAGLPAVTLRFNSHGTKLFADLTRRITGDNSKRIAFYLDDEQLLAPVSRSYIPDGRTIITGRFTAEETHSLAIQLKSGAIPVPLTVVKETTVDATLGKDSLKKSLVAGLVGLGLVLVFMVAYYRAPGLVASIALVIYAVLLLAIFKMMPVTLTLAGIAGLVLSIGMAVDANVLIFERVKEELRTGRTLSSSVDVGFRRAWTAIFDGNVSTLITCAILWWLGSRLGAPQVTSFALTLGIGVAVSMFTAVTVSRNLLRALALTRVGHKIGLFTPEGMRRPVGVARSEEQR